MGDWIKEWSGALATGFAAIIGLLGAIFGPILAKKQEQARVDTNRVTEAAVRGQADLFTAFNELIKSQQNRIEQQAHQQAESAKDREALWAQISSLTRSAAECERKNTEMEINHSREIDEMKYANNIAREHLEECKRDSEELKSRCDKLEKELSDMRRRRTNNG